MGGKGQRRREKNYRAAHGGGTTSLPPPPKASDLDAIPSKLRKIMQFKDPPPPPKDSGKMMGKDVKKRGNSGKGHETSEGRKEHHVTSVEVVLDDNEKLGGMGADVDNKKKRKRKRQTMDDLQLQKLNMGVGGTRRREKRKKYLEEKKKKKQKKSKIDEDINFLGPEQIKFGEVVEAPPKLTFPKASKSVQDAFHERLRVQAVEAYRKRKGWTSRPGIQLPPALMSLSSEEA